MKLHILDNFTVGHVLDPEIKVGDLTYVISEEPRFKWGIQENYSPREPNVRFCGVDHVGHFIKWLASENIPQDPREWDEEMHFRFQLRFG